MHPEHMLWEAFAPNARTGGASEIPRLGLVQDIQMKK